MESERKSAQCNAVALQEILQQFGYHGNTFTNSILIGNSIAPTVPTECSATGTHQTQHIENHITYMYTSLVPRLHGNEAKHAHTMSYYYTHAWLTLSCVQGRWH